MAKQKHKVARYQISLNEPQNNSLLEMMKEDMQTDISTFFGFLIAEVYKARQLEKNRKPVGRPRKDNEEEVSEEEDYADDLPKNINYYGTKIGQREYNDKIELQKQFQPK